MLQSDEWGRPWLFTSSCSFLTIQAEHDNTWRTVESPFSVQSLQNDVDHMSIWSHIKYNTDKGIVFRLAKNKLCISPGTVGKNRHNLVL